MNREERPVENGAGKMTCPRRKGIETILPVEKMVMKKKLASDTHVYRGGERLLEAASSIYRSHPGILRDDMVRLAFLLSSRS
jgi:hypothetical protein